MLSLPHTKYYSGGQIEKNEMRGARSTNGGEEGRGSCTVLVGKVVGKRSLGISGRRL